MFTRLQILIKVLGYSDFSPTNRMQIEKFDM